ncbi:MAG TPA: C4-type zinc ribbon domain-containing protein [bacterium]|nr:C4-type zinc ribbon domain-containing protein [bacterium]
MNKMIHDLIELQKADIRIEVLEKFTGSVAGLRSALAEEKRAEQDRAAAKKAELETAKKDLRHQERELATGEDKLKQIQVKLNAVKTNKEYEAALKEIEEQKKVNGRTEEEILLLYDKVEEAEKQEKALEKEWKEKAVEFAERENELDAKAARAETELAGRRAERERLAPELGAELLKRYEYVRSRAGRAVVRAEGEVCLGCHYHIPAQIYNEVLKGEQLLACNNCVRFMVHTEKDLEDGLEEI